MTWAQAHAMERSHAWSTFRGLNPQSRKCQSCGDTEGSEVRYCPGERVES
jgi:hypothetical protein